MAPKPLPVTEKTVPQRGPQRNPAPKMKGMVGMRATTESRYTIMKMAGPHTG